jgi:hypothetical protein
MLCERKDFSTNGARTGWFFKAKEGNAKNFSHFPNVFDRLVVFSISREQQSDFKTKFYASAIVISSLAKIS